MPDLFTFWTCTGLVIVSWIYSRILRLIRAQYEQRWTWLTVVIGNMLVGIAVAVRCLYFPIPEYGGTTLLVWSLWQWWWHMCAGGFPIVVWQVLDDRAALAAALSAALERKQLQ